MTDGPMIPGLALAGTSHQQWHVAHVQLVNWGGFDGYHRIEFDPRANLITGASGTGKSTSLDAYIAVMMNTTTAFNGASNDAVTGRARSSTQRNPLSYVRGKLDEVLDEDTGKNRDATLRGRDANGNPANAWSGLAFTFRHTGGQTVTTLRLYFAPASAKDPRDVKDHLARFRGDFDLRLVEPFAERRFDHRAMRRQFEGLDFYDSYSKFAADVHPLLGIGADGDGSAAMKLLGRIQAGREVVSVDQLYRSMVLERPRTFEAADSAIAHFADLEATYETMKTAEEQITILGEIPRLHAELQGAREAIALVDALNARGSADYSAFGLWVAQTERDLIEVEEREARSAVETARGELREAKAARLALDVQVNDTRQLLDTQGGGALEALGLKLKAAEAEHADAETAWQRFAEQTRVLGEFPADAAEFTALQRASSDFLRELPATLQRLDEQGEALTESAGPDVVDRQELWEEKRWFAQRSDLIPRDLDLTRTLIAQQLGVEAHDLPFAAELLDVQREHEQWRTAAELLLGSFARTLVVDGSLRTVFRQRVDQLRLPRRVQFRFAETDRRLEDLDPATLVGRLRLKEDSPYRGWLSSVLPQDFPHLAVEGPDAFRDDRVRRITLAGQVQNGDRGAHGGQDGLRMILGFSPAALLRRIEEELAAVDERLAGHQRRQNALTEQRVLLQRQEAAHQRRLETRWSTIDTAASAAAIARRRSEIDALLATNDQIAVLRTERDRLEVAADLARQEEAAAKVALTTAEKVWGDLVALQDEVNDRLAELDEAGVAVTRDQAAHLTSLHQQYKTADTLENFRRVQPKIRQATSQGRQAAVDREAEAAGRLERAFKAFQSRWPQPNLGLGVGSYEGYRAILDDLSGQGLAERAEQFRGQVVSWSGDDLLTLQARIRQAGADIVNRLAPVNEILADLPFGPGGDRLHIEVQPQVIPEVTVFQRELRELASGTTRIDDPAAIEARFAKLRRFIDRIRVGSATTSDRELLLDVRKHTSVRALRIDATTGRTLSIYDHLGGKSGGEVQELIAFIVGAALRYQLGTSKHALPVFAPVFLDEGFVKSDGEFTARGVNAWRGLGFQLIIAAPLDKVPAIEPLMQRVIEVTKTRTGYARAITLVDADEVAPDPEPSA
ncbi:ATP-binding protein [Kineococcus sp. SYSU DK003]|uniref:ATP-binding protein n=1 Tax=Kineococcus sp. SYSU DK003 TaxID=3383124 RepID=UPI003D7CCC22